VARRWKAAFVARRWEAAFVARRWKAAFLALFVLVQVSSVVACWISLVGLACAILLPFVIAAYDAATDAKALIHRSLSVFAVELVHFCAAWAGLVEYLAFAHAFAAPLAATMAEAFETDATWLARFLRPLDLKDAFACL
jgi:hypothetical protein